MGGNDDRIAYFLVNDCGQDPKLLECLQVLRRQEMALAIDWVLVSLDAWNGGAHVLAQMAGIFGLEDQPLGGNIVFAVARVQQNVVGAAEVHMQAR
jgi:hypothetical protein